MNILITGANLINKGAQAMLFTTVDQLYELFPYCNIFYGTYRGDSVKNYKFGRMYWDPYIKEAFLSGDILGMKRIRQEIWNIGKYALKKSAEYNSIRETLDLIYKLDCMIDISGFALSDKFDYDYNVSYLNTIKVAKKLNIPIFLLPQSFGPFQYSKYYNEEKAKRLRADIADTMKYPALIFARERKSRDFLKELGINHAVLSDDLVLQSKEIRLNSIYKNPPIEDAIHIVEGKKVAIIPNIQITTRGFMEGLFHEYDETIKYLLDKNYYVYIIMHSGEDSGLCREMYQRYQSGGVCLIKKDLTCFEYSALIKNFDFVISSRFHAIVHALKECIPAIAIGWAVKYIELMERVGQNQYVFDITKKYQKGYLKKLAESLILNMEDSRKTIRDNLINIQDNNCFKMVFNILKQ